MAGVYAILSIALLAWIVLKRYDDVARLLTPLLLAGILTLATMDLVGIPLNFANIIALPLLLSLGVSYSIYFVSFWRSGEENPLQLKHGPGCFVQRRDHPCCGWGTFLPTRAHRAWDNCLTISLVYCLLCTFFVLPVLLGRPKMD